MSASKRHIAILLSGIFLFPLSFQPLHVLFHSHHHEAHAEAKTALPSADTIKHHSSHCPVCSYELSLRTLPEIHSLYLKIPAVAEVTLTLYAETCIDVFTNHASSRAPPAII